MMQNLQLEHCIFGPEADLVFMCNNIGTGIGWPYPRIEKQHHGYELAFKELHHVSLT